jgi:hypothetical protein
MCLYIVVLILYIGYKNKLHEFCIFSLQYLLLWKHDTVHSYQTLMFQLVVNVPTKSEKFYTVVVLLTVQEVGM